MVDYVPWLGNGNDADAGTCFVAGRLWRVRRTVDLRSDQRLHRSADQRRRRVRRRPVLHRQRHVQRRHLQRAHRRSVHAGRRVRSASATRARTPATSRWHHLHRRRLVCSTDVCDGAAPARIRPATRARSATRQPTSENRTPCVTVHNRVPRERPASRRRQRRRLRPDRRVHHARPGAGVRDKPKSRLVLTKISSDATPGKRPGGERVVLDRAGPRVLELNPVADGVRVLLLAGRRHDPPSTHGARRRVQHDDEGRLEALGQQQGPGVSWTRAPHRSAASSLVINDKNTASTPRRRVKVTVGAAGDLPRWSGPIRRCRPSSRSVTRPRRRMVSAASAYRSNCANTPLQCAAARRPTGSQGARDVLQPTRRSRRPRTRRIARRASRRRRSGSVGRSHHAADFRALRGSTA